MVEIFAPYATPRPRAAWDQPIYSAEVAALIARWKAVMPEDELDGLNDGDWLCQCQDWDAEAFQATIVSIGMTDAGTAEVELTSTSGSRARARAAERWSSSARTARGRSTRSSPQSFPTGCAGAARDDRRRRGAARRSGRMSRTVAVLDARLRPALEARLPEWLERALVGRARGARGARARGRDRLVRPAREAAGAGGGRAGAGACAGSTPRMPGSTGCRWRTSRGAAWR